MRHFNRRAELLPEPRVRRRDHHEAVSGAKSFVGSDRRVVVADAVGRCPRRLHDASRHRECREHRVEECDVHVLAIVGAIAFAEGEQDSTECVEAGEVVGDRDARADRRTIRCAGDVHEP